MLIVLKITNNNGLDDMGRNIEQRLGMQVNLPNAVNVYGYNINRIKVQRHKTILLT